MKPMKKVARARQSRAGEDRGGGGEGVKNIEGKWSQQRWRGPGEASEEVGEGRAEPGRMETAEWTGASKGSTEDRAERDI